MQCLQGGLNPQPLHLESNTLPLSHHTPQRFFGTIAIIYNSLFDDLIFKNVNRCDSGSKDIDFGPGWMRVKS